MNRKTWKEFRDTGLLWWINRSLHLFGWAIVVEMDTETNEVVQVYPARVNYRGFQVEAESDGFTQLTDYMAKNAETWSKEIKTGSAA